MTTNRQDLFLQLVKDNMESPQILQRTPEPSGVTDGEQNVNQYNRVLNTNMTSNYAIAMDLMYRCRSENSNHSALDLCSGPGLLTMGLSNYLDYKHVLGVDLSQPMTSIAQQNAKLAGLEGKVRFKTGDVINLHEADHSFDLVSFTNAAHHLPDLASVRRVLTASEKAAKPEGIVVLTDIGRLKTAEITDRFVALAGEEFIKLNMPDMYEDFRNSMYAGWTAEELATCVPKNTKRVWVQMVPTGLTSHLALLGLPAGREKIFLRESYDWQSSGLLRSDEAKSDWQVLRHIVNTANFKKLAA